MFPSEVISALFVAVSDSSIIHTQHAMKKSAGTLEYPCRSLTEAGFLDAVPKFHPYRTSNAELIAIYRDTTRCDDEIGHVGAVLRMCVEEFAIAIWYLSRLRHPIPDGHFETYILSHLVGYCVQSGILPTDPLWRHAFSHWQAIHGCFARSQTKLWRTVSDLGRSGRPHCVSASCCCSKQSKSSGKSGVTLCQFHRFVRLCLPDRAPELTLSAVSAIYNTVFDSARLELKSLAGISDVLDDATLSEQGMITALALLCGAIAGLQSVILEAKSLKESRNLFARRIVTNGVDLWLQRQSRITAL
jgi:hypothetical protein